MRSSTKKTSTIIQSISVTSYADKFLDRRENAEMAIQIEKAKMTEESLTTTLIGLNAKLTVQNDMAHDVEQSTLMFQNSEV
jgi:hypothetical protein